MEEGGSSMKVENFPRKRIEDYIGVDKEGVERVLEEAKDLKGLKVVHVNATAFGGGVAELLQSLVPLMRSVGIDARWEVLEAPEDFFKVTKKFHNLLQGADTSVSEREWDLYMKVNEENFEKLDLNADVVVIHDPQPAALFFAKEVKTKKIWRCHIDLSSPNED